MRIQKNFPGGVLYLSLLGREVAKHIFGNSIFRGSLDLLTVPLDSRMYMYLISILLLVFTDSQTHQKQNLYTAEVEICIENFNLLFLLAV